MTSIPPYDRITMEHQLVHLKHVLYLLPIITLAATSYEPEDNEDNVAIWIDLEEVTITDRSDDWLKSLERITKRFSGCSKFSKADTFYYGLGQKMAVTYCNGRAVHVMRDCGIFVTAQHKLPPIAPQEGRWYFEYSPLFHANSFPWDSEGKQIISSNKASWTYGKHETFAESTRSNFQRANFNKEFVPLSYAHMVPTLSITWFSTDAPCFVKSKYFRFALLHTDGRYCTIAFETNPRQYEKHVFVFLKGSLIVDVQQDILCSMQIDEINRLREVGMESIWPEYRSFQLSTTEEHASITFYPSGHVKSMEYITKWIRPYDKKNGVHGHYPPIPDPAENNCEVRFLWQCDSIHKIISREIDRLPQQKESKSVIYSSYDADYFTLHPVRDKIFIEAERQVNSYMPIEQQYTECTLKQEGSRPPYVKHLHEPVRKLFYYLIAKETSKYKHNQ